MAALASWLDVRARGPQARWLVRIEDADTERCLPRSGRAHPRTARGLRLVPGDTPVWQTQRTARYQAALDALIATDRAYPCGCSRKDIDAALAARGATHTRHGERVYPGTCRHSLHGKPARAWRFAVAPMVAAPAPQVQNVHWIDRRLGPQHQDVAAEVGDFVLRRADGPWAYQLAVVVDDADQGVTDVVRGEDLADNTARQILLQRALGLPTPSLPAHAAGAPRRMVRSFPNRTARRRSSSARRPPPCGALDQAAQALGLPAHLKPRRPPMRWPAGSAPGAISTIRARDKPARDRPSSRRTGPTDPAEAADPAATNPRYGQRLKSFVKRGGRTTDGQQRALRRAWPDLPAALPCRAARLRRHLRPRGHPPSWRSASAWARPRRISRP